jgi:hypothetical protein
MFYGMLLSSCATVGKTNQLRIGMSKDEAISLMGDPKSTTASDSIVILNYSLLESFMGRYHPYYILLRDNKVSEYGKSDDFRGAQCPKMETIGSEKAK